MGDVHDVAASTNSASPPSRPRLGGIDHVEWWVGNARAFAGFLASAFGFEFVGYAGPETGRRDRVSHVLQQGRIRFLVTGALTPRLADRRARPRPTATGSTTSASSSTTPRPPTPPPSTAAPVPERPPGRRHRRARGPSTTPPSAPTARPSTRSSTGRRYTGDFAPGFGPPMPSAPARPGRRTRPARPHRRPTSSRAASTNGSATTTTCWASTSSSTSTTRPDLHRVLGPHVDGGVEPRQGGAADQRAGRGAPQEPDRGVPRLLPVARRPAPRPATPRHRRRRPGPA